MKTIACFIFFTLISFSNFANEFESESTDLTPDVDTVLDIYSFCVEQYAEHENIDTELLNCVNQDLETAAYQTFSSVSMLNKFISLEKGE